MKIAVDVSAIPRQPAGAGVYVQRLVEALARRGDLDLTLVSRRDDAERWRALGVVRPAAPGPRPLRLAWEQLAGPFSARDTDVWHGPHYTMPYARRGPVVVTVHDLTFFDHPEWHEPAKVRFFQRAIRLSARRADVLVCVSDATADRLGALLAPPGPVLVAPHGVDHERFTPEGDRWGDGQPYVLFVGTIEPRKNVPALVRAVARLDGARLVLAGRPGWGAAEVDAAIAAAGMADRVTRLGWVDDDVMAPLLRGAAAVAYPSFVEGFGLPALEALACGAPLVTTAGTAMADVVEDAAVVVPPGDEEALTEALRMLLAGGTAVDRLRQRGPEVAATHTWARSAERHVEAYRLASRL